MWVMKKKRKVMLNMCFVHLQGNTSIQSSNESTPVKKRVLSSWNLNYHVPETKITPTSPQISPGKSRFNLFVKVSWI